MPLRMPRSEQKENPEPQLIGRRAEDGVDFFVRRGDVARAEARVALDLVERMRRAMAFPEPAEDLEEAVGAVATCCVPAALQAWPK